MNGRKGQGIWIMWNEALSTKDGLRLPARKASI